MTKETLREFFDGLTQEEVKLAAKIASDRLGLVMRVAINELDLEFSGAHRGLVVEESDQERAYLMRIGVNRIIKLALQAHERFEAPTLTFQRDLAISLPVLELIGNLAAIEHGRRVAQSLISKSGRIERLIDGFLIELPANLVDLEIHERELDRYHIAHGREIFSNAFGKTVDAEIGDEVMSLIYELVYPWNEHFIGYNSSPKIDIYFFAIAYSEMQLSKGYDTFHFLTKFGGETFQKYKLAAVFIVSIGLRHRAYAQALLEKDPTIRLEDVLTVSVETEQFIEGLRDFINYFGEGQEGHVPVTYEGARTLFEVLSISRRNLALLDRPGAPIPPLIQCSDTHVIRPLAGAGSDVMLFLLNSLQHHFPKEYDRAQSAREGVMQRAVERILRISLPQLEYRGNVRLKQGGKVLTDIDLVVIEPLTNRVLLVQLKHQDPYGADLATMHSRTERLNKQVDDWLRKVRSWVAVARSSELKATLRLPSSVIEPSIGLLVLTRHFAHSLRSIVVGEDTAFSNYTQLVTAVARLEARETEDRSLNGLIAELRELSQPREEHYLPEPPSEWHVGNLRYSIKQMCE